MAVRRCHNGPGKFTHVTKQGDKFDRCPKAWLHTDAAPEAALISDYRWFVDHGALPHKGGRLDQHPVLIEAFEIIAAEAARLAKKAKPKG